MALPRRVAIGRNPHATVWLDQGHNEFSLFFRAVRAHCCHGGRQPVLIEPPEQNCKDASENGEFFLEMNFTITPQMSDPTA